MALSLSTSTSRLPPNHIVSQAIQSLSSVIYWCGTTSEGATEPGCPDPRQNNLSPRKPHIMGMPRHCRIQHKLRMAKMPAPPTLAPRHCPHPWTLATLCQIVCPKLHGSSHPRFVPNGTEMRLLQIRLACFAYHIGKRLPSKRAPSRMRTQPGAQGSLCLARRDSSHSKRSARPFQVTPQPMVPKTSPGRPFNPRARYERGHRCKHPLRE